MSSRFPTRTDLEVDAEGRAPCDDCGEFAVKTMVMPFTGNLMRQGPYCEACQKKRDEAEQAAAEERARARARYRQENIEQPAGPGGCDQAISGLLPGQLQR